MKVLSLGVQAELAEEYRRPIYLLEMYLNAATLRFSRTKTNVIFPSDTGYTFYARYFEIPSREVNLEGSINRISLKLDNTDNEMAAYAAAENFEDKKVIIYKVYRDSLTLAENYVDWYTGFLENPSSINHEYLEVSAVEGKTLRQNTINWKFAKTCPWIFGSTECNTNGKADLTSLTYSGTATSGTLSTFVCSGLGAVDDYWNFGSLSIEIAGTTYSRIIEDYNGTTKEATLDVALPIAISLGDTFTVYKGCDHTRETCNCQNAWGPSADNVLNFNGFVHVGSAKTIYYSR